MDKYVTGFDSEPLVAALIELAGAKGKSVSAMTLSVRVGDVVTLTVVQNVEAGAAEPLIEVLKLCKAEG